jgi:hypothetical protein
MAEIIPDHWLVVETRRQKITLTAVVWVVAFALWFLSDLVPHPGVETSIAGQVFVVALPAAIALSRRIWARRY